MEKESKKNLLIINDNFDDYPYIFEINSPDFTSHKLDFNDIKKTIKKLKVEKEDSNLVVLHKSFLDDKSYEKVNEIFFKDFGLRNPHILFVSPLKLQNATGIKYNDKYYHYILPNTNNKSDKLHVNNLTLFIKMIFEKIKDTERLNEYIVNSFKIISELQRANKDLANLSRIDYLTNILNRRAFYEALETERRRNTRYRQKISKGKDKDIRFYEDYGKFTCIIFDIDHFKNINDKYGHLVGDQVLKKLGELMISKNFFRQTDIGSRFGGEEFCVIMPETNAHKAKVPSERLRNMVKNLDFYDNEKNKFHITISIGVSEFHDDDLSSDEIIQRADQALYFAKENGRDQVAVYEEKIKDPTKSKITPRKKKPHDLKEQVDYFTNILNRETFYEELEKETKRTIRHNQRMKEEKPANGLEDKMLEDYGKFSCIIFDIDNFKDINQKYSRKTGDEVLKILGDILMSKNIFRLNDIISRIGGEEFCIILPETNLKNTLKPAERLVTTIKEMGFTSANGKKFHITVSLGLSEFKESDQSGDEIIARADEALKHAKKNGKNQLAVYGDLFGKS